MSASLKIAQLHWGFPPIIGGVETHLTILLPELVSMGHKVSLLTGTTDDSKAQFMYKGVNIFRSPLFNLNWLFQRGTDSLEKELTKTLADFLDFAKPDIIHTHNMHYFSDIHIKILQDMAGKLGVPLILTAHNVWDDMQFLKLTRDIKWDHIIAVSHFIKKEIVGIGFSEENITVIHHGIDTEFFKPNINPDTILKNKPKLKNRKIVFHPARMGLAKGCDVSIKAINMVRERFPDVLLVMGGTKNIIDWGVTQQKEIAYFVDLIKNLDLTDNVYIDFFSLPEMPEIYSLTQVCIYPSSSSEPFGLTMLEALSSGKPMIVTNTGGMPEIVQDDINGYLVKIRDFDTLSSKIIHLLSDDKLRNRLGRTGRQMVTTHYTKKIMTDAHVELYKKMLS